MVGIKTCRAGRDGNKVRDTDGEGMARSLESMLHACTLSVGNEKPLTDLSGAR